jgi:LacI family transcriptional regulator
MISSIREVARRASVSIGTVSNVLNRPELVAPETLHRVQKAMKEINFVHKGMSTVARREQSRTIGLILPSISNPFYSEVIRGVEDASEKSKYEVFVCISEEDALRQKKFTNRCIEQGFSGAVIFPIYPNAEFRESLVELDFPTILVDSENTRIDTCHIAVDNAQGARIGMQHLGDLDHRHVAWVKAADTFPSSRERDIGVRDLAKALGIEVSTFYVGESLHRIQGAKIAREILAMKTVPTAIFCHNDLTAIGVMQELLALGVSIPHEISILGFDDIVFARSAPVSLTTMSQPAYEIGFTAAELLIAEFEEPGSHVHKKILFQPQLVVRSSTGRRRMGSTNVA